MTRAERTFAARCARYGMTPAQGRKLLKMRKGCWVCRKTRRKDGRPLVLNFDHDHRTARVRGVLCFRCNKYLVGRHRDGRLLAAAARYMASDFDGRKIAA